LINWNNWQVLATTAAVGVIAHRFAALPGPAAIVIGSGLALSSTAVVLQVLPLALILFVNFLLLCH